MSFLSSASARALGLAVGFAALTAQGSAAFADTTLVWGKPAEITSFDVHIAGTVASWEMYQMVYETLLVADENLQLKGLIAESWDQPSPTTYVLKLREGVTFSNGRALDASDVVGSLERIKAKETASYWSQQLGGIAAMEAVDAKTVKIELSAPNPAFLASLAHISAAIIPVKEWKDGSYDPTKQLLGSGPFMVTDHKQDESWVLERNPHYWREGLPKADKLDVQIITDESARIAALKSGRIDFTSFENPDSPTMLQGSAGIKSQPIRTTNYYRLDVNAKSEASPLHDKRVRQALNLAVDREAINDLVFAGTTAVDYPVPASFGLDVCKSLDTYALSRDERVARAKALLAEAGQPEPAIEILSTSTNQVLGRIAQVAQQSLADAGFKVTVAQQPTAEVLQRVFTDAKFDVAVSWLAGYTDPSMIVAWWNPDFAVWNQAFQLSVPELNTALEELRSIQEGPERQAKLNEVCGLIDDGANLLSLVSKVDYVVYRDDQVKVRFGERSGSADTYQNIAEFESLK